MKSVKFKPLLLLFLSIFWLLGVAHLPKNSEVSDYDSYAEVASPKNAITDVIDGERVLYFFVGGHLTWLSWIVEDIFGEPDNQLPLWPERSRLTTLLNIISYQHYQTSLPQIPPAISR